MTQTIPSAVDILDFQFKLQCRLKVFEYENTAFSSPCNLLAVANRYGLLFVGSNNSHFQVIHVETIQKYNCKDGDIDDYYRRNIFLPSSPKHLSVNCDSTKLGVVVSDNCMKVVIYDILSFLQKTVIIIQEVRLSSTPEVNILDTVWNPSVPTLYTACKSDGSLGVYDLKETGLEINELPNSTRATCMCWSPKGKQLAVGTEDGKITQYKPDLKIAKVINSPSLQEPHFPIALQWVSNYQFIAMYRTHNIDGPASLIVINNSKGGDITYIKYEDICYSYGMTRPHQFYMIFQNLWNVLLVASSNSMEVGVLGLENDTWRQWILMDSARAELPLSNTKQETLPIGLVFDTSSNQPVQWGETTTSPAPWLLLLSNHGVLCCFLTLNLKQGIASICRTPEIQFNNSSLTYFTRHSDKSGPLLNNPSNLDASRQNILNSTISSTVPITTSFQTLQQCSPSLLKFGNTSIQTQPTLKLNLTSQKQSPIAVKQLELEIRPKADENGDTQILIAQMVKEECTVLESEFRTFIKLSRDVKINLGTDLEATNFIHDLNSFQAFLNEIKEIGQTQSTEVHILKQTLIQDWARCEEARSRLVTNRDPALMTLIRVQPLDTISKQQLEDVRHLAHYLHSQLAQASSALDEQWEIFQTFCRKKLNVRLPNVETIYQSMVKQGSTVQKQRYILKDISNRIKKDAQAHATPYLLVSLDNVDKLEENLENLQLYSRNPVQLQFKATFNRQKQLRNSKNKHLVHLLNTQHLNRLSVSKSLLSSKMMHFKRLLNTPISPILSKKDFHPQKLTFEQSTPKVLEKEKGTSLINDTHLEEYRVKLKLIPDKSATHKEFGLTPSKSIFSEPSSTVTTVNTLAVDKTFLGSAFVPTVQNTANLNDLSLSNTISLVTSTGNSKKITFDTPMPMTNDSTIGISTSIHSLTMDTGHSNLFSGKPVNTTGNLTKDTFENSFSNVNSLSKINFNFSDSLSTKFQISSTTNSSVKPTIVNPTTSNNFTFPFKTENNAITKDPRLSEVSTPFITSLKTLDMSSSDSSASFVHNRNALETSSTNSSKLVTNSSLSVAASTASSLKLSPTINVFSAPVRTFSNNSVESTNQVTLEPLLNNQLFVTTSLPNRTHSSTTISTSQFLSPTYANSNINLCVSTASENKDVTIATFTTSSKESKKGVISPDTKQNDANTSNTQSCPVISTAVIFPFQSTTVAFTGITNSTFSGLQSIQVSTAHAAQRSTSISKNTQELPLGSSFFGNSQQISSVSTGSAKSTAVASTRSLFYGKPILTSSSGVGLSQVSVAGSNTTTTYVAANVAVSNISPYFSTVTTSIPIMSASLTQTPSFGISSTTSSQTAEPTLKITGSNVFDNTTHTAPITSANLFVVPSTVASPPALKATSVGIFTTTSSPVNVGNTSSGFFTPSNTATAFGQDIFGSTSTFNDVSSTNVGNIFGSSAMPTNTFGTTSASTNIPFGARFGSNSDSGNCNLTSDSFHSPFSSFGNNVNSTNTTSHNFRNVTSTASDTFGNGYTQNPFGKISTIEQKSTFNGGSLFGSPATTSVSNIFGSTSPFNKTTPAFGGPATFGTSSAFGQGSGFGQVNFGTTSNVFGNSTQLTNFSRNNQSPTQSGFDTSPVFGSPLPFGSSTAGTFCTSSAFGSSNFGTTPAFNSSNTFGSPSQQSSTFANLANQQTLGFESLAQQNQAPTSQPRFSGGSSFSNWR